MDAQRTLRRPISCVGIGLHSGNKVTSFAEAGAGRFRHPVSAAPISATTRCRRRCTHLAGIQLATGLARNEVSVETVEHLLAALVSMGIDNVSSS